MLQNLHDNLKGVTAWILVGIITVPFVFFGVDSLFSSGSSVERAAEVNGEKITKLQLEQALQIRKQQLLSRFGEIDPLLLDDESLRQPVLQGLISQKVVEQSARDNGMDVAAATAYSMIRQAPDYQVNGVFDADRYKYAIRRLGYTPTTHIDEVRAELLRNQFNRGIAISSFATTRETEQLAAISNEKRDYYYLTVAGKPLLESIKPTEAEIQAFYEESQANYISEEAVRVEYIDIDVASFLEETVVDETQIEQAYQERASSVQASESRQVAHILLENNQTDLADDLRAQLMAGADFAELAREHSIDSGTAEQGGDLGYIAEGDLPKPMEQAIAGLSEGDISSPVLTDAGIHLIKLVAINKAEVASLESLRDELTQSLKLQAARDLFVEAVSVMADSAYNAQSLADTAELVGQELRESKAFPRTGGAGIASIPAVVAAAFSDDVLLEGYPSDVLEVADDRALVLRVIEHKEQTIRPLDEVREEVTAAVIEQQKDQQLQQRGEALIQKIALGASLESVAKSEGYPWQVSLGTERIGGNVDAEIRRYAFSLDHPRQAPTVSGFINTSGDFVVVSLTNVVPGNLAELTDTQRVSLAASSRQASAERELVGLWQLLIDDADVEVR